MRVVPQSNTPVHPEGTHERTVTALVVGAGIGGITTGIALKRAKIDDFLICEQSRGIGGTWWDNRYPGAEVDIHSHLYSFPFKRYDWTRTHAQQPEIHRYLTEIVDEHGLWPHINLGVAVHEATWDARRQQYRICLSTGESLYARVLITAVGQLNNPNIPDWAGVDEFHGPVFHTARWDDTVDLTGKRVAVVGSGSSAAQVVPSIAGIVDRLFLYQREPGWILPKDARAYSPEERAAFASESEFSRRKTRLQHFWKIQKGMVRGRQYRTNTKINARNERLCREYISSQFADHPELRELVTPNYPYAGKRTVLTKDFYPALLRDNVQLVPRGVERLTATGVVDSSGTETPVDVVIMATGFQTTNFLATLKLVGRRGRTVQDAWGGVPRAFLGLAVPEFPNFFMLYGPSTSGGEIFLNHKSQAAVAVKAIKWLTRHDSGSVEVRPSYEKLYERWLVWQLKHTAWRQANNYYRLSTGEVVTQWPLDAVSYHVLTRIFGRIAFRHRHRPAGADPA